MAQKQTTLEFDASIDIRDIKAASKKNVNERGWPLRLSESLAGSVKKHFETKFGANNEQVKLNIQEIQELGNLLFAPGDERRAMTSESIPIVAVIGLHGRGRTTLTQRISGHNLPLKQENSSGLNMILSLSKDYLLVDCAGTNSPLLGK